jgi:hypothetical protein
MVHRVRTHNWINGRLEVKDSFFEYEYQALEFANNAGDDSVKVYGRDGALTHDLSADATDTYA